MSRWCVTKVSPTYHHIPWLSIYLSHPVNKFHQIHYPDKSMINCSVYIFSQIRKRIQTMVKVKNSSQIHTDSQQSFVTIKPRPTPTPTPTTLAAIQPPPLQTFVVNERSQQVQNSFDHSSHFNTDTTTPWWTTASPSPNIHWTVLLAPWD